MGQVTTKHVSKDHSKFSTPPLEFLWWRADITKEDVRWVRQHLGRGLDGAKEFEVYPNSFAIGYGPIARDWRHRVHFSEGTTSPLVPWERSTTIATNTCAQGEREIRI
jgi:hypothetical protein